MLNQCCKVFLDTGIIIDLMSPPSTDDRKLLINQLIGHLSENKSKTNRVRRFYLSTISISEIAQIGEERGLLAKLSNHLNVSNLEIVPFDLDAALQLSNGFAEILSTKRLNEYAKNASFPSHELLLAREWITRDMMIAATAKMIEADVVFTTERFVSENRTTFVGIAKKLDLFCIPTYKEYFHETQGNKPIMELSDKAISQSFDEKEKLKGKR